MNWVFSSGLLWNRRYTLFTGIHRSEPFICYFLWTKNNSDLHNLANCGLLQSESNYQETTIVCLPQYGKKQTTEKESNRHKSQESSWESCIVWWKHRGLGQKILYCFQGFLSSDAHWVVSLYMENIRKRNYLPWLVQSCARVLGAAHSWGFGCENGGCWCSQEQPLFPCNMGRGSQQGCGRLQPALNLALESWFWCSPWLAVAPKPQDTPPLLAGNIPSQGGASSVSLAGAALVPPTTPLLVEMVGWACPAAPSVPSSSQGSPAAPDGPQPFRWMYLMGVLLRRDEWKKGNVLGGCCLLEKQHFLFFYS